MGLFNNILGNASEISNEKLTDKYERLLSDSEQIELGFQLFRDAFIFTNDDDLAHTIRGIVNHGMYERYHHDVVGVNSRLDSLQAVVLRAKLPNLDTYNSQRREAARKYMDALGGHPKITVPMICKTCDCHVFHQFTLRLKDTDRDALAKHLQEVGLPFGIYYPIPLHKQKAYADSRYNEADFPVTNRLVKEVISLPMHTELDYEQIEFITKTILEFLDR